MATRASLQVLVVLTTTMRAGCWSVISRSSLVTARVPPRLGAALPSRSRTLCAAASAEARPQKSGGKKQGKGGGGKGGGGGGGQQGLTARSTDFSQWYQDVIVAADLVDQSPVKGCMVIKPTGMAIWDAVRDDLDKRIKASGAQNAYFPLFIPVSFLSKEAEHVEVC